MRSGSTGNRSKRKYQRPPGSLPYHFYRRWSHMKERCIKKPHYKDVSVCQRWQNFDNFHDDMFASFSEHVAKHGLANTSIDRINCLGDYSPKNCRWATNTEQARNKSNSAVITYHGESLTIAEWGERLGIKPKTLHMRVYSGWSPTAVIETPLGPTGPKQKAA